MGDINTKERQRLFRERGQLVIELQHMERRAADLGLHITARGVNNAINACGWEQAGNLERAGMATRGERGGGVIYSYDALPMQRATRKP